jgi:hypothetical protein
MKKIACLVFLMIAVPCLVNAQEKFTDYSDSVPDNVLFERQWSLGALLHSNGWGLKFQKGYNLTALKQFMWEIEWSTYKSAKEVRVVNPYYSDSRPYIFGKLNYVSFLRGGVGLNHIFNRKPYWGGVQVSGIVYGGLSIGITKPAYVFVAYQTTGTNYELHEERYTADINPEYIYGRGSFLSGILELNFFPGLYGKTGLDFEFGSHNKMISSLEAGVTLDYSPAGIPIMALNPRQYLFLTVYVSVKFGKRYNR